MKETPIIVESGTRPVAACIWLHGLGADGHDFVPLVQQLRLQKAVRFILPHAPVQPVTLNGRLPMRAWFDIASLQLDVRVDEAGIEASAQAVAELAEAQGLPLLLAGFSQGGLIALHAALHHLPAVQGVLALSTWYPFAVPRTALHAFVGHGTQDEIVPCALGQQVAEALQTAGAQVDWRTYPMGHAVCPAEVSDINDWINERLEQL